MKWIGDHKEDIAKASIAFAGAVANPAGAFLGGICQLATDSIRGQVSSPEAYAGAMFGGAVGTEIGSAFVGGFAATGLGELMEKATGVYNYNIINILIDSVIVGGISLGMNKMAQVVIPYDISFLFRKFLSEGKKEFIETILAAMRIAVYFEIKAYCIE